MRKVVPAVVVVVSLFFHVSAFAEKETQGYTLSQYDVPKAQGGTSLFDLDKKGGFFIGIYFDTHLQSFGANQSDQAITPYKVGDNFTLVSAISDIAVVGSTDQPDKQLGEKRVGTIWPRKSAPGHWKKILGPVVAPALPDQGPILVDIENYRSTAFLGVNDWGHLVGTVQKPDFTFRGFVIVEGQISVFDYPGAQSTFAEGIRKDGTIVGTYILDNPLDNTSHGFLLYPNGQFESFDVPHACQTLIYDTNDTGDLAGVYVDCMSQEVRGYVFTRKQQLISIIYPGDETTATEVRGLDKKGNIVGFFVTKIGRVEERHGFLGLLK